jgi:hypothetical protein
VCLGQGTWLLFKIEQSKSNLEISLQTDVRSYMRCIGPQELLSAKEEEEGIAVARLICRNGSAA